MAMVVKNNMAAVNTLNKLNANSSELAKSLKKISSGMRVTGAGDDASAYSISERMQARIRGLNQCGDNTKTGKSMLTVAERAVNEQVQIAQKLKEIALKATDEAYSDVDRKALQGETTHLLMQINEISYDTNYNGKQLLTGRTLSDMITYFDSGAPANPNKPGVNFFPAPTGANYGVSDNGIPGYVPLYVDPATGATSVSSQ